MAIQGCECVNCNLCGAEQIEVVLQDDLHRLVRCAKCGLMYANPRSRSGGTSGLDDEEYLAFLIREHRKKHSERVRWCDERLDILEKVVSRGRLLDVGCSAGFFLQQARRRGWLTTGVEPSAPASRYAREELGLDVHTAYFDDHYLSSHKEESYDVVTLWCVLEHLPDPRHSLYLVHRILAPKGIVAIEVPNIESPLFKIFGRRWYHLSLNNHLYFFTDETLRRLLAVTGFEVISVDIVRRTFPLNISAPYLRELSRVVNAIILQVTNSGDDLIACARKQKPWADGPKGAS